MKAPTDQQLRDNGNWSIKQEAYKAGIPLFSQLLRGQSKLIPFAYCSQQGCRTQSVMVQFVKWIVTGHNSLFWFCTQLIKRKWWFNLSCWNDEFCPFQVSTRSQLIDFLEWVVSKMKQCVSTGHNKLTSCAIGSCVTVPKKVEFSHSCEWKWGNTVFVMGAETRVKHNSFR